MCFTERFMRRGSCAPRKTRSRAKRSAHPKLGVQFRKERTRNAEASRWPAGRPWLEDLRCGAPSTKMRSKARFAPQSFPREVRMVRLRILSVLFITVFVTAVPLRAQIGKSVIVSAGSEADHQLNNISAAADPALK